MNSMTWNRIKSGTGILLPLTCLFLFIAGCASSQKETMARDQMERAKKAYAEARANPVVEAYAPIQFQEAGNAVQTAEQASDVDEMLQLGYIAERKTQIAVTVAQGKVAERDIEKLNLETAEIIARKRTQEAILAQKKAQSAMLEAEKAMSQAEQARLAASAEAERAAIAKRQAEQARLAAQAEAEKAARAMAEADQLMKELSELKAQQTERGIVLTIGDVLFATGKAELSPDANRSVVKLSDFLKKYPNRNVLIEGHTDSVGGTDYNLALSLHRADSVKERLVSDGIEAGRITTVGYGKKYPIASNDTAAGRTLNRRVEVIILNEGVSAETQLRQ